MTVRRALAAAVLTLVTWCNSSADVPMLLNYQGHLTDASGNPENGSFTMDFAVFDAESGGTQLPSGTPWGETQSVQVTDGVFNVLLGSVTALPTDLFMGGPSDSAGPLRFLQVTVDGETLDPRRRIASVAYAISAGTDISLRLHNSIGVSVPPGADEALPFDTELWDPDDTHDETVSSDCDTFPNNCRFTVQTAGNYYIFGSVVWETRSGGGRGLRFKLNNTVTILSISAGNSDPTAPNQIHMAASTHYKLKVGDFVELRVNHDTGSPLMIEQGETSPVFGMVKLP